MLMQTIYLEKEDPHLWAKKTITILMIVGLGISFIWAMSKDKTIEADYVRQSATMAVAGDNALMAVSNPAGNIKTKKMNVVITAYSSTVWQTNEDPFTTASGKGVEDGIVANNLLPFGTLIRIPELYGDRIFVVEDRMHQRKGYYHVDIWFEEYIEAKNFGAKFTYIEVLEN